MSGSSTGQNGDDSRYIEIFVLLIQFTLHLAVCSDSCVSSNFDDMFEMGSEKKWTIHELRLATQIVT